MIDKAIVLAGGMGKRIMNITGGSPKVLLKVAGKSIIDRVMENLISVGIKDVSVITDRTAVIEDVVHHYRKYASVNVIEQKEADLIGALLTAAELIDRDALLVYGDILIKSEALRDLLLSQELYRKSVMLLIPEEDVREYGAVTITEDNFVNTFIEKPGEKIEEAYAYGGIMTVNEEFAKLLMETESFENTINDLAKERKIRAFIWSGWWVDVGYPWDLLKALHYLLSEFEATKISAKAKIADTAIIEGPVVIDDGAKIDHYVIIKGPVYIGKGVYVGNHSLIRPYTSLERGSIVHAYSEVFWSSLQEEALVGRGSFIAFSVLGSKAVIEPNVLTKVIVSEEMRGIRPIEVIKDHKERYLKLGAFISAGRRVKAGTVLEPGVMI